MFIWEVFPRIGSEQGELSDLEGAIGFGGSQQGFSLERQGGLWSCPSGWGSICP